jgi:hypothetical protein
VGLLIVANTCADGTYDLMTRLSRISSRADARGEPFPLRWVAEPVAGKSHALSRAIHLLTSEPVAFADMLFDVIHTAGIPL